MRHMQFLFLILSLSILSACGGGGGGGGVAGEGSISGIATKGPVDNATVTAYAISNGVMGAQIGTTTSDTNGNFTMITSSYAGSVMLQMSGGSYTDEATGTTMNMSPNVMTAVIPNVAAGATISGIQMTPLTAMAQSMAQHMSGGMTEANITAANTAMGSYFSVSDILHTQPMNPLVNGSGSGASQDAKNYGICVAAMSQEAKNINMAVSSAMVTAMMSDASDGVMNGKMGSSQVSMTMGGMMGPAAMASTTGTSDLATAMTDFMNSAANHSGLTAADMAALINKLTTSNGQF